MTCQIAANVIQEPREKDMYPQNLDNS